MEKVMTSRNYLEKSSIAADQGTKERNYWLHQLSGDLVKTSFPYDYRRAGISQYRTDSMTFALTEELNSKLMQAAKGSDRAMNLVLIAGLTLLLNKYTGSKDIIICTPIYRQEMDGDFINTVLPLRIPIKNSITFKEFIPRVRQTILDAVKNQNYPIELLIKELNLDTGTVGESFPLFDIAVLLENIHEKKYLQHIQCNMTFSFKRNAQSIRGVVEYNSSLYEKTGVEKVIDHFKQLLYNALFNAHLPLSDIEILLEDEKKQLLEDFNNTTAPYPKGKTIIQWFEEQVEKTPNHTAVSSPIDLEDIYDQLETRTIKHHLEGKPGTCCFKRNPYSYQSLLELPGKKEKLNIIKTHQHNSVIVNNNIVELLTFLDGKINLKSIYSRIKNIKNVNGIPLEFLIYSMNSTDLLEVTFQFTQRPEIFFINGFGDLVKLVQSLYRNHLIALADIYPGESKTAPPAESIIENFSQQKGLAEGIVLDQVLIKSREIEKAPVLLLGDTPGTPTTGLLYLASHLRRKGIKAYCQFYDPTKNYASMKENIETLLEKIQPAVVGISLKWFLYISRVIDMCEVIKEYSGKHSLDIKVVLGGNTASYYWQKIIKYDCIDYLVRGDGEEPLLRICQGEDLLNIPNCVYKRNGKIFENSITYVQDQTNSSGIYLSHLDEILLSRHASCFGTFFIYTHKGCTMNCLYCGGCSQAQQKIFNREHVFQRRVEEVRKDIIAAKKYASTFQFEFDIRTTNLLDYCKKIWEDIELSNHFCIFSTLKSPSTELIRLVSKTFKYVYWDFDICTFSGRHREQLSSMGLVKPQPSDEEILDFMAQCERYHNIEVRLNLITGLPYFTSEDIEPGEKLLSKIMNSYSCFGELHWARLHAQPGAPILEDAGKYHMHTFASTFDDFLKYSKENFHHTNGYAAVEDMNYPYIYFNDDRFNSRITNFYLETNKKVDQHDKDRQRDLIINKVLTYRELNEKADRLAEILRTKGVGPGKIVGIILERSLEIPLTILAVLKSGAAYMPIDPEFPAGRVQFMLQDSNAKILLTTKNIAKTINFDREMSDLDPSSPQASLNVSEGRRFNSHHSSFITHHFKNLAYVIYTSGTTGKPKGVLLTQENLVNYVNWFTKEASLTGNDKTMLISSFAFDLGYTSLYTSLLNGGELHILPRDIYLSAERLLDYIKQKEITYIKLTPSLFSIIVNHPNFSEEKCPSLGLAAVGGEVINVNDIEKAHSICSRLQIMNHYGPTEATIGCVATFIDFNRFDEYKEHPVIGKPIDNTSVYILGKDLNLMPVGVPGELCIAGTCLSRGYLNRPELTVEKFIRAVNRHSSFVISNPSNLSPNDQCLMTNDRSSHSPITPLPHSPIYRTGDLARWLLNGTIEFLGRNDKQVKIRGYRIELGEIESRLRKHHKVEEALVVVKEPSVSARTINNENRDVYLCAYIVPKAGRIESISPGDTKKITGLKNIEKEEIDRILSSISRFEEMVKRNHDQITVKSNGKALTYGLLDKYACRVARKILENYDDTHSISKREKLRYKRQMLLHGWDIESQERLKGTTAFVAGAGGGGSSTIMQLALLGFGTIYVCDCDVVELSNLNRQFLHDESRIGMNKALSAKMTIERINPNVKVVPITQKLTRENVFQLVGDSAVIFDMFDGMEDKFILSEYAVVKQIPHIIIAMTDLNAYTGVFHTPHTPCYHCIFDKKKFETIVSGMQNYVKNYNKNPLAVASTSLFISTGTAVNEALKILLGFDRPAYNNFFYFNQRGAAEDLRYTASYQSMTHLFSKHFKRISKEQDFDWDVGWRGNFLEVLDIQPDPDCPVCGPKGRKKRKALEEQMEKAKKKLLPIQIKTEKDRKNKDKTQTVALLLNHDIEMAVGLIGALKSSKTCVPFDPASSIERLRNMLEDSESRIILTNNKHLDLAKKLINKVNKNVKVINIGSIDIDELIDSDENPNLEHLGIEIEPEQPAYMLYWPGSTTTGGGDFNESVMELYRVLLNGNGAYIFMPETINQPSGPGSLSSQLRAYLQEELPEYMLPSNFVQLERIPLTPNGKLDRKALPDPGIKPEADNTYKAPRNELEEKLAKIWTEVLEIETDVIGIDSNFFELGGHSLNITIMMAKIHKELDVRLQMADIFRNPTLRGLSELVKGTGIDKFIFIEAVEKKDFYELSYNQKRLWIINQVEPEDASYNMFGIISLLHRVNEEAIQKTLKRMIQRHESFRTSFREVNGKAVQVVEEAVEIPYKIIDISSLGTEEKEQRRQQILYKARKKLLELIKAPLFWAILLKIDEEQCQFIFNMHHIICDGWSIEILKKEFNLLYESYRQGKEVDLKPLMLQYKDFAEGQNKQLSDPGLKEKSHKFWLEIIGKGLTALQLPRDIEGKSTKMDSAAYRFTLAQEIKDTIKTIAGVYHTSIFMVVFAALNLLLARLTNQKDILTGILGAGRENDSLQDIVGFFVNTMVYKGHVDYKEKFVDFLNRITNAVMEIMKHQDYPLELILDDLNMRFPDISVLFNMFNMNETAAVELDNLEPYHIENVQEVKFEMILYATEYKNGLEIQCHYRKEIFVKERIEYMMRQYQSILENVAREPRRPLGEYVFQKRKRKLKIDIQK